MFKQKFVFEVKGREDRYYSFLLDPSSPREEVYEVLTLIRKNVFDQMQQDENKESQPTQKQLDDSCKEYEECKESGGE